MVERTGEGPIGGSWRRKQQEQQRLKEIEPGEGESEAKERETYGDMGGRGTSKQVKVYVILQEKKSHVLQCISLLVHAARQTLLMCSVSQRWSAAVMTATVTLA